MKYIKKGLQVVIEEGVVNLFNNFKQTGKRYEQGGVLLGYSSDGVIYVKRASVPTVHDKSYRFRFIRDKRSAQLFIDYEHLNSCGRVTYLGEWHTHPEDSPTPSGTDLSMIKTQFEKNDINEDFLLMLIVGRRSNYLGYFDGKKLIELS